MNKFRYGLDIETLGLPDVVSLGNHKAKYKGPSTASTEVFGIGMSRGSRAEPAFLGHTKGGSALSIEELINKGKTGDRVHKVSLNENELWNNTLQSLKDAGQVDRQHSTSIVNLTQSQLDYIQKTSPNEAFVNKFIDPTKVEASKLGGSIHKTEKDLLGEFTNTLKRIEKEAAEAGVRPDMIGHNIKRFDIPNLVAQANKHDSKMGDELNRLLGEDSVFNIIDTRDTYGALLKETYEGAVDDIKNTEFAQKHIQGSQYAKGTTLDVATDSLGVPGRQDTASHGSFEDAVMSLKTQEVIEGGATVSPKQHTDSILKYNSEASSDVFEAVKNTVAPAEGPVVSVKSPALMDGKPNKLSQKILDFPKVTNLFKKITKKKLGIAAGVAAIGWFVMSDNDTLEKSKHVGKSVFSSITDPFAERDQWATSSMLGMTEDMEIMGRTFDYALNNAQYDTSLDAKKSKNIMDLGTRIHRIVQDNMRVSGASTQSEAYFEDPKNKVFGYADVMLKGGTPLEIKTVSESTFAQMSQPKEKHVSQANFYALASKSPNALIMYVSRANIADKKVFSVAADAGRYERDVASIRKVQDKTRGLARKSHHFSGFRPLNSWFGGGINYNMPTAQGSKYSGQRIRSSGLPMAMNMPQQINKKHPNNSRAGI